MSEIVPEEIIDDETVPQRRRTRVTPEGVAVVCVATLALGVAAFSGYVQGVLHERRGRLIDVPKKCLTNGFTDVDVYNNDGRLVVTFNYSRSVDESTEKALSSGGPVWGLSCGGVVTSMQPPTTGP